MIFEEKTLSLLEDILQELRLIRRQLEPLPTGFTNEDIEQLKEYYTGKGRHAITLLPPDPDEERAMYLVRWLDGQGLLPDHSFTFPDGDTYYAIPPGSDLHKDPEPQPSDGPEYETNHAFWEMRQRKAGRL